MRHEINIHRRGEDELPRAVPTSARYAAALIAAMLASSAALPVLSQGVELVVVDIHAVADGYRASKLIGNSVVNDQNEKIGTIEDIIIGRDRVLFAVLQVGGLSPSRRPQGGCPLSEPRARRIRKQDQVAGSHPGGAEEVAGVQVRQLIER